MENPTRSDFFMVTVNVGSMYVVASSCGLEGKAKTPAEKAEEVRPCRSRSAEETHRLPAESEVLHGNQQRCTKRSTLDHLSNLFAFKLD
jgi:hypothetical protein